MNYTNYFSQYKKSLNDLLNDVDESLIEDTFNLIFKTNSIKKIYILLVMVAVLQLLAM